MTFANFALVQMAIWPILYATLSISTYQRSNTLWGKLNRGQRDSEELPTSAELKVPSMGADTQCPPLSVCTMLNTEMTQPCCLTTLDI